MEPLGDAVRWQWVPLPPDPTMRRRCRAQPLLPGGQPPRADRGRRRHRATPLTSRRRRRSRATVVAHVGPHRALAAGATVAEPIRTPDVCITVARPRYHRMKQSLPQIPDTLRPRGSRSGGRGCGFSHSQGGSGRRWPTITAAAMAATKENVRGKERRRGGWWSPAVAFLAAAPVLGFRPSRPRRSDVGPNRLSRKEDLSILL